MSQCPLRHIVTAPMGQFSPSVSHCHSAQWVRLSQLTRWVRLSQLTRWVRLQGITAPGGSIHGQPAPGGSIHGQPAPVARETGGRGVGAPGGRRRVDEGGKPPTPRTCKSKNPLAQNIHNPHRLRNPLAHISTPLAAPPEPVIPCTQLSTNPQLERFIMKKTKPPKPPKKY